MKAILKFKREDVKELEKDIAPHEDDVCEIEAINSLVIEHMGYYGKPHGSNETSKKSRFANLRIGCSINLPQSKNENLRDFVLEDFGIDIHEEFEGFGKWLTSGYNFTGIGYNKEHVYVLLDGARHGLRKPFHDIEEKAEWTYIETWLPEDAHPYDTRDCYAQRSLENLKAAKKTYKHEMYEYEKLLMEFGAPESDFMGEYEITELYFGYIENVEKHRNEYHDDVFDEIKEELFNHLALRGLDGRYNGILDKTENQIYATYFRNDPEFIFYQKMKKGLEYQTGYEPNNPFSSLKKG